MPETRFIVTIVHEDGFDPIMFHTLMAETLVESGQADDPRTRVMNTVEVTTAHLCGECSLPFDPDALEEVMLLDGESSDQPMGIELVCPGCYSAKCYEPGYGWSNAYADPDDYELVGDKWQLKAQEA